MDVVEAYILSPCLLDNIEILKCSSFKTCLFFFLADLPLSLLNVFPYHIRFFFFWQSLCSLVILSHTCPPPKTKPQSLTSCQVLLPYLAPIQHHLCLNYGFPLTSLG